MPRHRPSFRPRRRSRPFGHLEILEGRALLSTFNWNTAESGNFSDPLFWDGPGDVHEVPGSGDNVVTPAGNYTITSSSNETINTFTGGAKLDVTGGKFTLNNTASKSSTSPSSTLASLTVASGAKFVVGDGGVYAITAINGGSISGTLTANGDDSGGTPFDPDVATIELSGVSLDSGNTLAGAGVFDVISNVSVNASTTAPDNLENDSGSSTGLTGSGPLTIPVGQSFLWSSGTIKTKSIVLPASTVAGSDSGLEISGGGPFNLDGATVSNGGLTTWTGSSDISFSNGAVFNNLASGEFEIETNHNLDGGSKGTFNNSGDLVDDGGKSSVDIDFSNNASGTNSSTGKPNDAIDLESGDLTLPAFTNGGAVDLAVGAVLSVSGNYTQSSTGSVNISFDASPVKDATAPLQVSGKASLGGKLDLAGVPSTSFVPTLGVVFPIATFASSSGKFASFVTPTNGGVAEYVTQLASKSYSVVGNPSAPKNLALVPGDVSGKPGQTMITRPQFTGQADPGTLIQIYDAAQVLLATGTTASNGTFTATAITTLDPGTYVLRAVEIDSSNVYGPNSAPFTLTVLALAPEAPTDLNLVAADDTGGPGVTAIHDPQLTGQAPANLLVQIYDQNKVLVASGTAGADGTFVAPVSPALAPGSYTLTAVAVSSTGQYGATSSPFSLTITPPPPAPKNLGIDPADDTGGPGTTSVTQPRLTGTATAGDLVQIYDQDNNLIASATAGSNGAFVATPISAFPVGTYVLKAVAIDAGNNYGAISSPFTLTIT